MARQFPEVIEKKQATLQKIAALFILAARYRRIFVSCDCPLPRQSHAK